MWTYVFSHVRLGFCKMDDCIIIHLGFCKMDDLEYMKEGDVHKFGLRLKFRGLLQHQAKQKKKRASDGSKEHKVHYLDKTGQQAK